MAWGQWMIVNLTIEEELQIEALARTAIGHPEHEKVADLCAALVKQNAYQKKILQQAVRYISELEIKQALAEDVADAPWWNFLGRKPLAAILSKFNF